MNPIDFGGQRSKVKVTMDIYGNKLVNMIATKRSCASLSNLTDMLTMVRGWTLLIFEVRAIGYRSRSQWTRMVISCEPNTDWTLCPSSSNLTDILEVMMIDFGGHSSNVKVTMGIIDKFGVRADATLCVAIFLYVAGKCRLRWKDAHTVQAEKTMVSPPPITFLQFKHIDSFK